MTVQEPVVFVVDDDASARGALESLMNSVGLRVEIFASAAAFLERPECQSPCCLVLDVRLPRMSGLELQKHLAQLGSKIPIIFITAHGDIPMSVEAMKAGAVEFLTKPFRGQDILDAIHHAIDRSRTMLHQEGRLAALRGRVESLTSREREVMRLVIDGLLNKQIAGELGTSERTVKIHRANVMRKMGADSLPDLVRMAERARVAPD